MTSNPVLWMDTREEQSPLAALTQIVFALDYILNPRNAAGAALERQGAVADIAKTSVGSALLQLLRFAAEELEKQQDQYWRFANLSHAVMNGLSLPEHGPTDFRGSGRRFRSMLAGMAKLFTGFLADCGHEERSRDLATAALYAGTATMVDYEMVIVRPANVTTIGPIRTAKDAP